MSIAEPEVNLFLRQALYKGDKKRIMKLLSEGADIETRTFFDGTLLLSSVKTLKQIRYSVKEHSIQKKKPEVKKSSGKRITDQLDLIELLLKNGANAQARGDFGKTPFASAVYEQDIALIKLLLKYGVNIEEKDKRGRTPLMNAVESQHINLVELLLKKGANMEVIDSYDVSLLTIAMNNQDKDMVKYLIKNGIKVEKQDKDKAFYRAEISGNKEILTIIENALTKKDVVTKTSPGSILSPN